MTGVITYTPHDEYAPFISASSPSYTPSTSVPKVLLAGKYRAKEKKKVVRKKAEMRMGVGVDIRKGEMDSEKVKKSGVKRKAKPDLTDRQISSILNDTDEEPEVVEKEVENKREEEAEKKRRRSRPDA
jgi:hypothetical protein